MGTQKTTDNINKTIQHDKKQTNLQKKENISRDKADFGGTVKSFLILIKNKEERIEYDKKYQISQEQEGKKLENDNDFFAVAVQLQEDDCKIIINYVDADGKYQRIYTDNLTLFDDSISHKIEDFCSTKSLMQDSVKKRTAEILKTTQKLIEGLRNYGNLEGKTKFLIVTGILLALHEIQKEKEEDSSGTCEGRKGFVDSLDGSKDGEKIYVKIESALVRAKEDVCSKKLANFKIENLLSQFSIIKTNLEINTLTDFKDKTSDKKTKKTPLRFFTEFLNDSIYNNVVSNKLAEKWSLRQVNIGME